MEDLERQGRLREIDLPMAYDSMTYDIHEDQLDAKPRFTPLLPNKQNEGTHHPHLNKKQKQLPDAFQLLSGRMFLSY